MKLAIVGGRLQAIEAAYLARAAGYDAALIDPDPFSPARTLVQACYSADLLTDAEAGMRTLRQFDIIFPATEKPETLSCLNRVSRRCGVPLAFDALAYETTASKIRSNRLFEQKSIPMPPPWPGCGFPVIVKPSAASGSSGVFRAENRTGLDEILALNIDEPVIQACLDGPSYSLEIIGHQGDCTSFLVVLLEFDAAFDCKRVLAGPETGASAAAEFHRLARRICRALSVNGIMDIEVIQTADGLKVLEIDARFPSQTPMAVYHATGINLLEETVNYWLQGKRRPGMGRLRAKQAVILEHIRFRNGNLEITGEHALSRARQLQVYKGLFGSETIISNFEAFPKDWAATAVYTAEDETAVWKRREAALDEMKKEFGAAFKVMDPSR